MASKVLTGSDKVMAHLHGIAKRMGGGSVSIGFMNGATYPNGTLVSSVAFWNEFGTINAPARPFFRNMIAAKSPGWGPKMANLAKTTNFDGSMVLALMGEDIKGALQHSINTFTVPALAPSTIARKGFEKPLIDTAHMLNSITYKVNP